MTLTNQLHEKFKPLVCMQYSGMIHTYVDDIAKKKNLDAFTHIRLSQLLSICFASSLHPLNKAGLEPQIRGLEMSLFGQTGDGDGLLMFAIQLN